MSTIFDHMLRNAEANGDATAFLFLGDGDNETDELSHGALATRALAVARLLERIARPGDRVLLFFQPGLDFVAALYGCFAARVIAVPCYPPRPKKAVLSHLLEVAADCDTKLVLTTGDLRDSAKTWFERLLGPIDLEFHAIDSLSPAPLVARTPPPDPDDIALLQYTSGSTGSPKGVVIRHRQIYANLMMIAAVSGQTHEDRGVLWLPPYHDMGLIGGILLPVYLGARMTLMPPAAFIQRPMRWLRAIERYGATSSGGPNFAYQLCVDRIGEQEPGRLDLHTWRTAFNGAEPIREDTLEAFARKFAPAGFARESFLPCYGMAEATLMISGGRGDLIYRDCNDQDATRSQRTVACGAPAPETTVLCVDPESRTLQPDGHVGELWVDSPSVARAYWGKPEQSAAQLRAQLAGEQREFLRTGDFGFIADGRVFVTGRQKDMLIVRGRNLYPQDLERVAEESHPCLRKGRSVAFSVTRHGEEQVVLVSELEREALFDLQAEPIISGVRRAISDAFDVVVHAVVLVKTASIPVTSSGKVRRFECRARYLAGSLDAVAADARDGERTAAAAELPPPPARTRGELGNDALSTEIERWLLARIGAEIGQTLDRGERERELADLGLDSLQLASISGELSDWLNLRLPPAFLEHYGTVARAAAHLAAVVSVTNALQDKDPDERIAILRSAQTERTLRFESTEAISPEFFEWSALPGYRALNERHDLMDKYGIPTPFYVCHDGAAGATSRIGGVEFLNFATNNYLAFADDPRVIAATCAAVQRYGSSVSASRIVSGERPIHRELERELADFLGTEDALALVSGNLTNTSVIGHLMGPKDLILYDELSHDSMVQGAALSRADAVPFPHNDWRRLGRLLEAKRGYYEKALVFTEGTFSMDGDVPDLPRFVAAARAHRAWLMVDEALSLGTLGATGRGITEHYQIDPSEIDILMGVLSKSLASCGGYLAGNRHLIRYLRYTLPGHVYTTGMTGANAAGALTTLRLLKNEPWRVQQLQARAQEFLQLAQRAGLDTGRSHGACVVPVIIGDPIQCFSVYVGLRNDRINVQPIVYPAVPKDASRLRFFFSCAHTSDQLRWAVERIAFHLESGALRRNDPARRDPVHGSA